MEPPPPKVCCSPNGPPVTAPRVRLKDGRYLAYKEKGVPREHAKHKIIIAHGTGDSKNYLVPELVEELGIYLLSFDRAGYGESDPNPKRTVKSDALDIEDLANQLDLGPKFYVIGVSMGLAGVALVVPVVNYWWPSLPPDLSKEGLKTQLTQHQWLFWVAHHAPFLLHWWMTQKWFPSLANLATDPRATNPQDREVLRKLAANRNTEDNALQQGPFESIHRDLMVGFGHWDFDPLELDNPFPDNDGSVHIWQGYEDRLIPVILQRYVSKRLPWIQYHELPHSGHLLLQADGVSDAVLVALLVGEMTATTNSSENFVWIQLQACPGLMDKTSRYYMCQRD
ncbi:hypothetical protein ACLOJK_020732 [Asimina triloba]